MPKSSDSNKDSGASNITTSWGRGASQYRPGLFTKQYLAEHGEAYCGEVFRGLTDEIERLNKERTEIGEKPLRKPNYSSFAKYFHWFKLLGLVERTDRTEPAAYPFLEDRVYYRLTGKGRAEEVAWADPVRAAHPEYE